MSVCFLSTVTSMELAQSTGWAPGGGGVTTPKAQYYTIGSTHRQKDVPLKEIQTCSWGGFKNNI